MKHRKKTFHFNSYITELVEAGIITINEARRFKELPAIDTGRDSYQKENTI
jgi:hypothetical protein